MKRAYFEIDSKRILELMNMIENHTGKMFHETYPELDAECVKALDSEIHASYLINKLAKLVDKLRGES